MSSTFMQRLWFLSEVQTIPTVNDELCCIKSHIICKFQWAHWVTWLSTENIRVLTKKGKTGALPLRLIDGIRITISANRLFVRVDVPLPVLKKKNTQSGTEVGATCSKPCVYFLLNGWKPWLISPITNHRRCCFWQLIWSNSDSQWLSRAFHWLYSRLRFSFTRLFAFLVIGQMKLLRESCWKTVLCRSS